METKMTNKNKCKCFRISWEPKLFLSIMLSTIYIGFAIEFELPLIESPISSVFATFFVITPIFFITIVLLEELWFMRLTKCKNKVTGEKA